MNCRNGHGHKSQPSSRIETYTGFDGLAGLRRAWNGIIDQTADNPRGLDFTNTFDWCHALWESHRQGRSLRLFVLFQGKEIKGILPCVLESRSGSRTRTLRSLTSLYGGRQGFIVDNQEPAHVNDLLAHVIRNNDKWDIFLFSVVQDGPAVLPLGVMQAGCPGGLTRLEGLSSPFIELPGSWDALVNRIRRKKTRYNLRRSDKALNKAGRVSTRIFTDMADMDTMFEQVFSIERHSWKHSAGTAIPSIPVQARFYRSLMQTAARNGLVRTYLLYFDGRPIAYVMGVLYRGIYYDLKESYDKDLAQYSPGQVLKHDVFDDLIGQGIRYYDFMGECEPFKMLWEPQLYRLSNFAIYSNTLRGRLLHMRKRLGEMAKRIRPSERDHSEPPGKAK